jgi:predicted  nucleic acid-binding Zn-ribbon protein
MRPDPKLVVLLALISSAGWLSRAHAEGPQYYPESTLNSVYGEQEMEEKRAVELDRQKIEKRDRYEKLKRDTERQIESHRFEIESLKMRSEKAQQELDQVSTNLAHVKDDISSYEEQHKKFDDETRVTVDFLNKEKNELDSKQKELDNQIASLADAKKKAERYITDTSMEVARMKADISRADTKLAEAEANRAVYEADEMAVRTDWMRVKMEAAEHLRQRDDAVVEASEAKKKSDAAQKELAMARTELARAEKEHTASTGKAHADIGKYEKDIQVANHNRISAEAEKIRLESETSKVQEYASRMKDSRDDSVSKADEAQGLVLKSTVALTSARTELGETIGQQDRAAYRRQKEDAQSRGLASAAEAHQIKQNGNRSWTSIKECPVYSAPNEDDTKQRGKFAKGTTVFGRDSGLHWLEVRSPSGDSSVFIRRSCGHFDASDKE